VGFDGLFNLIAWLRDHSHPFGFGVVGLAIGPGLLLVSKTARTVTLALSWPLLAISGLFGIISLVAGDFAFMIKGLLTFGFIFAMTCWQYSVLRRPDICALFGSGHAKPDE
jgi:hypothetical protein